MKDLDLGEMVILDRSVQASNPEKPGSMVFIVIEKKKVTGRSLEMDAFPYYYIFNSTTGKLGPFRRGELEQITRAD